MITGTLKAGAIYHGTAWLGCPNEDIWVLVIKGEGPRPMGVVIVDVDPGPRTLPPGERFPLDDTDEGEVVPDDQVPDWVWGKLATLRMMGAVA